METSTRWALIAIHNLICISLAICGGPRPLTFDGKLLCNSLLLFAKDLEFYFSTGLLDDRLKPLQFEQAGKFAAEFWLLNVQGDEPRVKDLHLSNVDHYVEPYPRERYAKSWREKALLLS